MKKRIAVKDLAVGMYVERVTKSTGSAVMKSKGVIKHPDGIAKLKSLNVQEVEVDFQKSDGPPDTAVTLPDESGTSQSGKPRQSTSLSSELQRAQSMYARARDIQKKAFEKVKAGGNVDLAPYEEIASAFFDSVFNNQDALLCMTRLQDKDNYLLEHSLNVAILLAIFSTHLGFPRELGIKLTLAGLLHDLGKCRVPDTILFKQGRLTAEEFEHMKLHTIYGKDILDTMDVDDLTKQIALQHHERLSGSGYPYGLVSHQLNQYVRMSAIADVFDAITAERIYKPAMSSLQALKILRESGESEFDADLLNQFVRAIGLYSIGTVVLLKSQKLAIVTQTNYDDALKPKLTAFYHTKFKHHIDPQQVTLSSKSGSDAVEKVVNPADYQLDVNSLIERFILDGF